MRKRVPLLVAGLLVAALPAAAETQAIPSWLKIDETAKTAVVDIVAAFNPNNSNWNFNGYHSGDATLLVPPGWTIEGAFHNEETDVPHSLVVMADPGSEDEYPSEINADAAAFDGAHTHNPLEGTTKGSGSDFSFTADKPGDYLWYCGVPGHGNAGMWIRFRVTDDVPVPAMTIADEAEPGRQ